MIIVNLQEEKILGEIRSSLFFSILIDDTCDVSQIEQFCLTIRYLDENAVIKNAFIQLRDLGKDGGSADNLKQNLLKILEEKQLDLNKAVGISAVGASTFQGKLNGMIKQLQNQWNQIISTHCCCHKLQLALKKCPI
ncbi:MAG: hypothetical protein EZS28_045105 [Streblomastix strix]|uniref:Uncharacterized protein n=1 Tax=Streblomastix strix TaxID=222440 RepID=A0A5J4TM30_9EUKA|nr:MAG: hypothetical protein EZS28_045105 [Streblomastix strix]